MANADRAIVFGRFRLEPDRHILLEGGKPVSIGTRALEILIALLERPGEVVSKDELVGRAWPNTFVEESNLRAQVAVLRKALDNSQTGMRYIAAVPGRGYRFVAEISHDEPQHNGPRIALPGPLHNLPTRIIRPIGRSEVIKALGGRLKRHRFVTIVGPGGIGKTTVAVAIAEEIASSYEDGLCFLDLAPLASPALLPSALASALNVASVTEDPTPALIAALRNRSMLVILDSCEHVVEAAAVLTEQVLKHAEGIHILATSREPLRADGERVHRLEPLDWPSTSTGLTAAAAVTYPAVELFVERAASNNDDFDLSDADAPIVAEICQRLDGMALAIELAAARIDAFGVRGLAAQLDDRFRLLTLGRRTALPRHQTLSAALDWSYEFLSDSERVIFRRMSVFKGFFTLETASKVAQDTDLGVSEAREGLANLVAKSLLTARAKGDQVYYRFLDTTRAYALDKLTASGELNRISACHANQYVELFKIANAEATTRPMAEWLDIYGPHLDNIRAALDWAFSPNGDATTGVSLILGALPLWMHSSLMNECRARVDLALSHLETRSQRNPHLDMQLFHARGAALLNIEGNGPEIVSALSQSLTIAESLNDTDFQLRALWCLWCHALNNGQFRQALTLADKFYEVALRSPDPIDPLTGQRMRGFVLHFLGAQTDARRHVEYMLNHYETPPHRSHIIRFQFDQLITARTQLAQILWLQGFVDQALHLVEINIEDSSHLNHSLSFFNALAKGACHVTLWGTEFVAAERYIGMLLDGSSRHGLDMWHTWGNCYRAILLIKRGETTIGLELLETMLKDLPENRFTLRYTWVLGEYADGLRQAERISEGLQAIEGAIARCERDDERWHLAELLRIKGEIIRGQPAETAAAEALFRQATDLARRQNALSWELRSTISLARLRRDLGRVSEAYDALAPVYSRFSEGAGTADLQTAKKLLDELS